MLLLNCKHSTYFLTQDTNSEGASTGPCGSTSHVASQRVGVGRGARGAAACVAATRATSSSAA